MAYLRASDVFSRWPGLCARMWAGRGCTAWGKQGCNTVITNSGRCLFTECELKVKAKEANTEKMGRVAVF